MKYMFLVIITAFSYSCTAQDDKSRSTFEKAKTEYNLITTEQFSSLNCSETINKPRMLQFFKDYPQFHEDVKIVSIPNCYGAPNEKFFVLLYDKEKKFYVPRSLPDVYKNDGE